MKIKIKRKTYFICGVKKMHRILFVVSIVGLILSSLNFDGTRLVTSASYKGYLDYVTNYQNGGDDEIGIGVAKYLFFVALLVCAMSEKFSWIVMILHALILSLQIFALLTTKFAGMVSYWHTIIYGCNLSVFFFFIFLILYILTLLLYIIQLVRKE